VLDLGLGELLDEGGVVAIEWGDAVVPVLPSDYLEVRLTLTDIATPDDREIALRPVGPRWGARQRVLAEAIAPWAHADHANNDSHADDAGDRHDAGDHDDGNAEGVAPC
jgi:hypothetical protein